ncbi:MAG TPA: hypothetical protein VIN71_11120 [Pseudomonadales bacterium]
MNNNKEAAFTITNRQKDRQSIADQIEAYLARGGQIEVLGSPFDKYQDPKCRVGDEIGFFSR